MDVHVVEGDLPGATVEVLLSSGAIAIDTETTGLDWASDHLAVCQLFAPNTRPIVLRHVTQTPSAFNEVMASPEVRKVFHFAPFDLRFLQSQWGSTFRNIACTKAASKLLFPSVPKQQHSLASLVARYFNVTLDKGSIRTSDWSAPSLTKEQLRYAISDVEHLLPLLDQLENELHDARMLSTYQQICDYMVLDAELEVTGVPDPLKY